MKTFPQSRDLLVDRAKCTTPVTVDQRGSDRLAWTTPTLSPHSTLTVVTQVPLPKPLNLLFFQTSRQCFNEDGTPATCPGA